MWFKDKLAKKNKSSQKLDRTVHAEDLSIQKGNQYKPKEKKPTKSLSFSEESEIAYLTGINQRLDTSVPAEKIKTKTDSSAQNLGSFEVPPSDEISRRKSKHAGRVSDDAWEIGLNLKYRNEPVGRIILSDFGRAIVPSAQNLEKQQKKQLDIDKITAEVQEEHEQKRSQGELPQKDDKPEQPRFLKSILKGSEQNNAEIQRS